MFKKLLIAVVVIFVGAIGVSLGMVEKREAEARADFPPDGDFVDVDGHPVHYVELGEGPAVVLIDGASGNTRDFTFSIAGQLADKYRVIVFDRPGLGHTPALDVDRTTLIDQSILLSSAAENLGVEQAVAVGHSFGGAVMMGWALEAPESLAAGVSIAGAINQDPDNVPTDFYANLGHPLKGPIFARFLSAWAS